MSECNNCIADEGPCTDLVTCAGYDDECDEVTTCAERHGDLCDGCYWRRVGDGAYDEWCAESGDDE